MHGINYEMSSRSTRLQRLPMLEGFVSQIENPAVGQRFPSNPALARHPIRHRQDGPDLANYALAIQLGSGSFTRNPDSRAKYSQDGGQWRVSTVWLNMTVIQFGPDDYALSYTGTSEKVDSILGQDMRLTEYEGFDNTDSQPSTLLGWGSNQIKAMDALRLTDAATPKGDRLPMPMLVDINGNSSPQKNWVPILDDAPDGAPLWITHYSPFVVVDCGRLPKPGSSERRVNCLPHRPEMDQSDTQAFEQYSAKCLASLPSGSEHWRGSAPLVRLPWNRRLALGTVHQRGYTKDGLFYDAYRHRFVLVDLESTSLAAYTDEFAIFSSIDDVNWFEFLTGCTLYKDREVLLSFGYNDQEPWLAILHLRGILQWLIPVEPKWESLVDQARAGAWQ
ncbi:BZ3500_MvSof-1268-A1-R1_Chr9g10700 [Microbotryum saponariae]|uniref:BZ3500_MvSof-1268-A1-R1_Chr9g10700 protein n=1 Tax=Microbotryum saponariae TaxID=289078 RepID=A0A2X0KCK9_9BASI|nr:BZ3501_MvSof-1269-A2-R1_Chr9g10448 [Microbotryum saponariae]SDA00546.1 BZ3500_MvSof-1268-A1-R1_Chr9g10700 [Microbotryum saponariae]